MTKIILVEQIYDNKEWGEFLDSLPTQQEKDTAGLAMDWIKKTYPEFKDKLNGKLIAEITQQK